jgi:hypothetical protein
VILTTAQGGPVADDQNTLKVGERGLSSSPLPPKPSRSCKRRVSIRTQMRASSISKAGRRLPNSSRLAASCVSGAARWRSNCDPPSWIDQWCSTRETFP